MKENDATINNKSGNCLHFTSQANTIANHASKQIKQSLMYHTWINLFYTLKNLR
jgi:hypothetical protein